MIYIYTDGAASGNPGPGGYGVVMELAGTSYRKEFSEGFRYTTNNRMELLAAIIGLEQVRKEKEQIILVTDSKYIVDAVNKKWVFNWEKKQFQGKKNPDLWKRFLKAYRKHHVEIKWIKGHNNHPQNERCDFLAVTASKSPILKIDKVYENTNNSSLF